MIYKFRCMLGDLPPKYQFTLHNIVGHPVCEVAELLGFEKFGLFIHRNTLPLIPENKKQK